VDQIGPLPDSAHAAIVLQRGEPGRPGQPTWLSIFRQLQMQQQQQWQQVQPRIFWLQSLEMLPGRDAQHLNRVASLQTANGLRSRAGWSNDDTDLPDDEGISVCRSQRASLPAVAQPKVISRLFGPSRNSCFRSATVWYPMACWCQR
jgi:hypothetical protein